MTGEPERPLVDETANGSGQPTPFVGLRPYTELEESIFFGRERDARVVASNLVASRLTLLYGPSGVGKSSLLHAAVVPQLRTAAREAAPDGEPSTSVVVFASWRDDPVAMLLQKVTGSASSEVPLVETLRDWTEARGTDLLVILDQFEEYFLYHGATAGEDRFSREFPDVVNDPMLRANFLVSMRDDALAQLDVFKGVIPRLFRNYLRVGYLDSDAARRAILGPVAEYNRAHPDRLVEVEPALVDAVLDQVESGKVLVREAGAGVVATSVGSNAVKHVETSHLQVVLARLWTEELSAGSTVLRSSTLERLGGAAEIVRSHVDVELAGLSAREQETVAAALRFLVTPSGTKIAHSPSDLAILTEVPDNELRPVLERLSAGGQRILRHVEPAPGRSEERYEIFHDVLTPAVTEWRRRYVEKKDRAAAEEELRRQRREAEQRAHAARRRARNVSVFSVVLALLVIAIVLFIEARRQNARSRSRQQAAQAVAYLQTDPTRSLRDALTAVGTASTAEADSALRQALAASRIRAVLAGHSDWVNRVAFDPDGTEVVTASNDGTARIWDVATGKPRAVLRGHTSWVATAVFDPSGATVLTASADGTARIWDARSGQELRTLGLSPDAAAPVLVAPNLPVAVPRVAPATKVPVIPTGPMSLVSAAFDATGSRVVTAGSDGVARIYDSHSGALLRELSGHTNILTAASFDATGTHVVTSSVDGTVRVWDVASGRELARLTKHEGRVAQAVFSPDGMLVATAGDDGNAFLWRWQTGDAILLSGHTDGLQSVEFDAQGDKAVTSGDKTARVWDTKTGQLLAVLQGHSDWVTSAVFSPDGRRVATSSQDGTAVVWDVATGAAVTELRGHRDIVWDVAFSSSDPLVVATAGSDGTARLWELPQEVTLPHQGWVLDAQFSPDGRAVVTSGNDGAVRIWDAASGQLQATLSGFHHEVDASFSPNGQWVVTIDDSRTRIWDWRRETPVAETSMVTRGLARFLPTGDTVMISDEFGTVFAWNWHNQAPPMRLTGYRGTITLTDLEISPDGRSLVTAGSDRVARVWDVSTGQELATMRGHDGVVYSARFSADSRLIVTSSADGTVRLWNAISGKQVRTFIAGVALRAADLDRAGRLLVAGAVDGSTRVWDARSGRILSTFFRHSGSVNSVQFSPAGLLMLSSSDDDTAAIYSCPTCQPLQALESRARAVLGHTSDPEENSIGAWALLAGDCYDARGGYAHLTGCGARHESEVFAVLQDPADYGTPFDQAGLAAFARTRCEGAAFTDYVGLPLSRSSYRVATLTPTDASWSAGDRRIVCSLYGRAPLTTSAHESER